MVRDTDSPRSSFTVENSFCYPGFVIPDEFENCSDSCCAATVLSIGCRPGGLTENRQGSFCKENAKTLLRSQQFILEAG